MRHFEADREIERAFSLERLAEVCRAELAWGDEQPGAIDPGAVVPEQILHAVFPEDREPGAKAAADIDDALRRDLVEDQRHRHSRRFR